MSGLFPQIELNPLPGSLWIATNYKTPNTAGQPLSNTRFNPEITKVFLGKFEVCGITGLKSLTI